MTASGSGWVSAAEPGRFLWTKASKRGIALTRAQFYCSDGQAVAQRLGDGDVPGSPQHRLR